MFMMIRAVFRGGGGIGLGLGLGCFHYVQMATQSL